MPGGQLRIQLLQARLNCILRDDRGNPISSDVHLMFPNQGPTSYHLQVEKRLPMTQHDPWMGESCLFPRDGLKSEAAAVTRQAAVP